MPLSKFVVIEVMFPELVRESSGRTDGCRWDTVSGSRGSSVLIPETITVLAVLFHRDDAAPALIVGETAHGIFTDGAVQHSASSAFVIQD